MRQKDATRRRMSSEMSSVTGSIDRAEFSLLNDRLTNPHPPIITAADLIKEINAVEALLPPDPLYERMKDSRSMRPKKNRLINKRYM